MNHMEYLKRIKRILSEMKSYFENSYKAFIPVSMDSYGAFYADYKNIGCPFGDSKRGLNSWIRLRKRKAKKEFWESYKNKPDE